ncbi:MAG: protein kinase [Gemmataceae bacterium]|nr:protein kinase [Gemmataceae bacterium]
MPLTIPCPDVDTWRQLLEGRLPGGQIDLLAEHLDSCPACSEQVQALASQMTWLGDRATTHLHELPPGAARVMNRLRHLLEESETSRISPPDPPAAASDHFDFLRPPEDPSEIGRLAQYRVLRLLGRGGMGFVFLAHDPHLDRPVALKVMRPEIASRPAARERFLREARLAAKIKSDHIVTIYQVSDDRGVPFLAMELLQGMTLETLLRSTNQPLEIPFIAAICRQIAAGLAAAHEQGLIHRDIKPANVWIESGSTGRVKLLDFGLARADESSEALTQTGMILGTPAYMAPEQARGEPLDARADLWSLGVVLYELLTRRRPFIGANTLAILASIAMDDPPAIQSLNPLVPEPLARLTMQLLEKNPASRPTSAREIIATLDALLQPSAPPLSTSTPIPLPDFTQRHASVPSPSLAATRSKNRRLVLLTSLALLLPLGFLLGGTIIRVATNKGEIVVDVDDPNLEVRVIQNGVVVQDKTKQREFVISAGDSVLEVYEKDGIGPILTRQFTLNRGDKITLKITLADLADAKGRNATPTPAAPAPTPMPPPDPDRRAANFVLAKGGGIKIKIGDVTTEIRDASRLPSQDFHLLEFGLPQLATTTDDDLAHFDGCRHLTNLHLHQASRLTNAALRYFENCKLLVNLNLAETNITDEGLRFFRGCSELTSVNLRATKISDAGLAYLKDCKKLTRIDLRGTPVTDLGLTHLKDCTNLTVIEFGQTKITGFGLAPFRQLRELGFDHVPVTTDALLALQPNPELTLLAIHNPPPSLSAAGLAVFKTCAKIRTLSLVGFTLQDGDLEIFAPCENLESLWLRLPITDRGLAPFQNKHQLKHLTLECWSITDAGLACFKGCRQLTDLRLESFHITDAGLAQLHENRNIGKLALVHTSITDLSLPWINSLSCRDGCNLTDTRISREGFERLRAAHPDWILEWSERNHHCAQAILQVGGKVWIASPGDPNLILVKHADELIRPFFQVRRVKLGSGDQPILPAMEALGSLTDPRFDLLSSLDLSGCKDVPLATLKNLASLEELNLAGCQLDDVKLGQLPTLPSLKRLILDGNDLGTPAVFQLTKTAPQLQELSLACPNLGTAALLHLSEFKNLKRLSLAGSQVNDASVKYLAQLSGLEELDLRQTRLTPAGIEELKKAMPKCRIVTNDEGPPPNK